MIMPQTHTSTQLNAHTGVSAPHRLILNKNPPTYQAAGYIRALRSAISLLPGTAVPQSTDSPGAAPRR